MKMFEWLRKSDVKAEPERPEVGRLPAEPELQRMPPSELPETDPRSPHYHPETVQNIIDDIEKDEEEDRRHQDEVNRIIDDREKSKTPH